VSRLSAYRTSLTARADALCRALPAQGLAGNIDADSYREYSVKVTIQKDSMPGGQALVYYSPKRDAFTLVTSELRPAVVPGVQAAWAADAPPTGKAAADSGDAADAAAYRAYVDGAFIDGRTGYGAVILRGDTVVARLKGAVRGQEALRQVGGELEAVRQVLAWCTEHDIAVIAIYYDYTGIEAWATGKWKTNNPVTRAYAREVGPSPIAITWHKVKSHAGDRWNNQADHLARQGASA
jgi:ribonuclease H-related protein